jgi:hypothetical protein
MGRRAHGYEFTVLACRQPGLRRLGEGFRLMQGFDISQQSNLTWFSRISR